MRCVKNLTVTELCQWADNWVEQGQSVQEIPEALRPVPLESPADLQLQQISRDTVYKHVLKHAADSRPKAGEAAPHTAVPWPPLPRDGPAPRLP